MTVPREIERDVELGRSVHEWLLDLLVLRLNEGSLNPDAPTRLPDWSVAHLLTHLARNADSHRRMFDGAERGEMVEQYEGGVQGRNDGIAAGVGRPAGELVEDLRSASAALEDAWDRSAWVGEGRRTLSQTTPISHLPLLRVREVQLHGVDLGIGVELEDLDRLYVRLEVDRLSMLWCARQPMGMAKLPGAALAVPPTDRLGWLTGRREIDGLAPAGIF